MDRREVPTALRRFVKQIEEHFQPERIILFGSHARGDAGKWSDYDILVISDKFEGIRSIDRKKAVYRYHPGTVPLDILCLTPAEYEKRKRGPTIIQEISREGVELVMSQ